VKAVGSEARVIAETLHTIVDFAENKCREKQSGSGSGVLGRDCAANDSHAPNSEPLEDIARIESGRDLGRKSTKQKGIFWKK
jgi:hypothetical protein